MTVASHETRNQYVATSGQTTFSYTFEITAAANLLVYKRAAGSEPDDAADLLTYITDYTVTGVDAAGGGTIILVTGATLADIVTIQSAIPVERDTSFTPSGLISAEDLNTEFDNQTLIEQKIQTIIDKLVPKYAKSAVVAARDLVLPNLGNNQIWAMDTDVGAIQAVDYDSGSSSAALKAELASHDAGEGCSLVGLQNQSGVSNKTVQDLANAAFIVKTNNGSMQNAQALGSLTTGILKNTAVTGLLSISAALTSIDALATSADQMLYTTASNVYATTTLTSLARALLADTTAAAARSTLGAAASGDNTDITSLTGLTGAISFPTAIGMAASGIITTNVSVGNAYTLRAYDTLNLTTVPFVTLTAGNPPTADLSDSVTKAGGYIYRAGGTDIPLLDGGTNASLTASNGGIVYSGASALAILAGTATAGKILRSGSSAAPAWSTATYPGAAGTNGNALISDGTNFVSTAAKSGSNYYVATDGSDITGNGKLFSPYALPTAAMSAITGGDYAANPCIILTSGIYTISSNLATKSWVSIFGTRNSAIFPSGSEKMTIGSSYNSDGYAWYSNLVIFCDIDMSFESQTAVDNQIYFSNCDLSVINFTDKAQSNIFHVSSCRISQLVTLKSSLSIWQSCTVESSIAIDQSATGGAGIHTFNACLIDGNITLTGVSQSLRITNTKILGSITITGTSAALLIDASFPLGGISYAGGATSAQVTLLTDAAYLNHGVATNTNNAFTKQNGITPVSITSSSNVTAWDLNAAPNAVTTLTENTSISNPTNAINGYTYELHIIQHASSAKTVVFDTKFRFPSTVTPIISTILSSRTKLFARYNSTSDTFDTDYSLGFIA